MLGRNATTWLILFREAPEVASGRKLLLRNPVAAI